MTNALLDRLRSLRRYDPEVPALLAELAAGPDPFGALQSAGRILARPDEEPAGEPAGEPEPVRVTVGGSGTLDGLTASLTAEFARHGLRLDARQGDFGAWERDLLTTDGPVYAPDTALSLCVLDSSTVFDTLPRPWTVTDVAEATADLLARLDAHAARHGDHARGMLVLNTLPLLRSDAHQLVDLRARTELAALWRDFNAGLLRLVGRHPRTHVVDLDPLVAEGGPVRDARLSAYAKARLGSELLARYAREIGHLTRTLRGRTRKVLVLDADQTLWDGVLGDVGPEGIAAAGTVRGEAFAGFQRVVGQLAAQGVLLAVCSKNDRAPLLAVLREHPDMTLREPDFVQVQANWGPKSEGLRQIAERLGLGIDSLVLADDSAFERGQVASALPGVALVPLDDEPALHTERLLADGWFDTPQLTDADLQRADRYRSEGDRHRLRESARSYEEYLARLDVVVDVAPLRPGEVARVAQLTQRTNQFNLTTRRMTGPEVSEYAGRVLTVTTRDKFGDNGLVGAVFLRGAPDGWHLDNVLLSCRVFGRGIEQAVFAALLEHAKASGAPAVHGTYRPTARNGRVRDLYPSLGFLPEPAQAPGPERAFRHPLLDLPEVPSHITLKGTYQ
ncbi:HAD-IIIC family phosphatase [Streptomyces sp. S.PB5]|uniref:HAD-IIIC family phosphatase n=1 Tax=Streptomyces sp. S.PB5 TaxID=3020844 RepID=UPI0025B0C8B3|nr:HAD-IIIC family phosphatase [Streptomyces sp. S.PB5]MDN3022228.1 HAD-IIIC family phosphatase [Streptomyces sp. S.PB5]